MKRFKITVGNTVFDVTVEDAAPGAPAPAAPRSTPLIGSAPVNAPAPAPSPAPSPAAVPGGGSAVRSPLAGKIVAVDVQPGSDVGEADRLLTIEAMKMNTHVYAPKAGKVGQILVVAGDAVEEGQELLRLV
jgi:biotin carboxyl carrier protein